MCQQCWCTVHYTTTPVPNHGGMERVYRRMFHYLLCATHITKCHTSLSTGEYNWTDDSYQRICETDGREEM